MTLLGLSHLIGHLSWRPRPSGADGQSEARVATSLLRYLRNGLESVELTGVGASGTDPGHGKPRAGHISAPRHGSTRDAFTANRMSILPRIKTLGNLDSSLQQSA